MATGRTTRQTSKDRTTATQLARGDTGQRPVESTEAESPELTLLDIQRSIKQSSDTLCGKFDALSLEIASISTKVSDLEASVTMNSDKIHDLEENKLPDIQRKMAADISKLEDKLTAMEIYCRRTNLLFYGVKELPNENVENVLRSTFCHLGIESDEAAHIALVNVHRLPRRDNAPDRQASGGPPRDPVPRAIIAKFVYMRDRNRVLAAFDERQRQRQRQPTPSTAAAAASNQDTRRITVRTDLPPALKATRSALASIAYKLRKEKNVSTRISVVGTKVLLHWKEKGTSTWNLHQD